MWGTISIVRGNFLHLSSPNSSIRITFRPYDIQNIFVTAVVVEVHEKCKGRSISLGVKEKGEN